MMDALTNWSDRTDEAMEQSIENTKLNTNSDQGAALPASPSSKIYSEFFAENFSLTRRAIQGRNAYAAWARKLGTTKKDDPEFLRVHEELRKSGENLDKVLSQMGNIPLFKLPASEKELDQLVENHKNLAKNQEEAVPKVVSTPLRQDRPESAPQGKKSTKRTRDSEGFISPPKHLTRKAPKANPNVQIAETMHIDANPDVDINSLDPVVELGSIELVDMEEMEDMGEMVDLESSLNSISFCKSFNISMVVIRMHQQGWGKFSEIALKSAVF
ncbi:hypothetical protein NPIL_168461 [Nephila pilipes]|uniref:Uncharacterized protein n=1 Tax=Nephila pilipes TaxID=299642 RepID=A0A8X6TKU0_NEPPI|nr:hypothetical protein NPIL_168461 [Nephila pilipes]